MTDYALILAVEYPGTAWTLDGSDYAGLTWLDESPKPTKATLDKKWPKVQHDFEVARIAGARRARYQAETDGIYFDAMRADEPLDDWKAAVAAIKADLPYPPAP